MKVVALGGGHGLSRTLQAVRTLSNDVVAVVSTADDGGSSGRLREEFAVPPPGDLRMALLALADSSRVNERYVWAHRFAGSGGLAGHNLGNLMLTALWQQFESEPDAIVKGLDAAGQMLGVSGRVLPVTSTPHHLVAGVNHANGAASTVVGQSAVTATNHRITHVHVDPQVHADTETLKAIQTADLIVLGPGSWFTSVLAVLCADGVCEAINESAAAVAVVMNLRAQPGEADGFQASDYLASFKALHPDIGVDAWVVDSSAADEVRAALGPDSATAVYSDNLADASGAHDPQRLAVALASVKNSLAQTSH
ncbi:MAG: YvcK family protein [Actinobacteria bacterium]|nr:YvcK family protein [Actinomycetota bacterium]